VSELVAVHRGTRTPLSPIVTMGSHLANTYRSIGRTRAHARSDRPRYPSR